MNSFRTSTGEKISKTEIDRRVREAKKQKIQEQLDELGYNRCEECGMNDCKPLDCSHIESVNDCQRNGYCEKAWALDNIRILGRKCHQQWDGLDLRFKK